MTSNCLYCQTSLMIPHEEMVPGWCFSQCTVCQGYLLLRKSEIKIIKVDKAPAEEKILHLLVHSHEPSDQSFHTPQAMPKPPTEPTLETQNSLAPHPQTTNTQNKIKKPRSILISTGLAIILSFYIFTKLINHEKNSYDLKTSQNEFETFSIKTSQEEINEPKLEKKEDKSKKILNLFKLIVSKK